MKNIIYLLTCCFIIISFDSCGSDEPDNPNDETTKEQKISRSIIGVWTNGQLFVSFSEDRHYAAYLDMEYLESGSFEISNDSTIITCRNEANGNFTTYAVSFGKYTISVNPLVQGYTMTCNVKYINHEGQTINKSITFQETDVQPVTNGNNPLKGKTGIEYKEQPNYLTYSFNNNTTGIVSASDNRYSPYPLPINYIYIKDRLYIQKAAFPDNYPIIEKWNDNHFVSTFEVSPLGENMVTLKSKDFLGF